MPAAGLRLLRPGEGFARQRDGRVSSPCGRGLPSGDLQLPVQPGRWGDAVRGGGRPCCVSRASQACACVSVRVRVSQAGPWSWISDREDPDLRSGPGLAGVPGGAEREAASGGPRAVFPASGLLRTGTS